jgi:spore coat-associated protein N
MAAQVPREHDPSWKPRAAPERWPKNDGGTLTVDATTLVAYQDDWRPRRRRVLIALMVMLALASFGATAGSLALFTDTATVAANDFTAGAIDIAAAPASAMISYSPMMPGDSVTGTLTVSNAGSAQLRYAMTTVTTNPDGKGLNAAIALEIRTQGTSCAAFDGVSLYSGTLAAAAMGNVAAGDQAGDRTLNGGTGEVLCFRASLPIGTGNGYQAATTTATFTFEAEQTANNP